MADARALTRVMDELIWSLRRAGLKIPVSSAIDALAAVREVGLSERADFVSALAAVVVKTRADRARFDRAIAAFFARASPHEDLFERLARKGFTDLELEELRELLRAMADPGASGASPAGAGVPGLLRHAPGMGAGARLAALLARGPDLDRLLHLSGLERTLSGLTSPLQLGFFTFKVSRELGLDEAHDDLAFLGARLRDALGPERAAALIQALRAELEKTSEEVRSFMRQGLERRAREAEEETRSRSALATAFTSLSDADAAEVRRAVRVFGERLRGGERVRKRRAKRGPVDVHRTMRRAMRTGGVPFDLVRRRRHRDKPKLWLLCDVSDSVRAAARFMLELVYVAQELFERTRSFVFVSELGETTDLFTAHPLPYALGQAYGGAVVSVADNSNYGRVLRAFEERHLSELDRRSTVVVLGDGRTNYHDDAADVLARIRERARALVWLCPEERAGWLSGDSAMPRYARHTTHLFEVKNARELEEAARAIAALR